MGKRATGETKAPYKGAQLRVNLKIAIMKTYASQAATAKEAGLTEWELSRIVRGWLNPSTDQLERLAKALNVEDPNDLLT